MEIENPAFNYDQFGHSYSGYRKSDPVIAIYIHHALGDSQTVLNVGAGSGSYEPADRFVMAVEPSPVMRSQRIKLHRHPAVNATAETLPFDDQSFDASMALVTVHHWPDIRKGLKEMRRVTRRQIVIMTFDPDALQLFWNSRYFPELIEIERLRYPKIHVLQEILQGSSEVISVPVPFNCIDGFQEAFYGRPEGFLDPQVRKAQSAWGFLDAGLEEELVLRLKKDLDSGAWDEKYGHYRNEHSFTGALRLIITNL